MYAIFVQTTSGSYREGSCASLGDAQTMLRVMAVNHLLVHGWTSDMSVDGNCLEVTLSDGSVRTYCVQSDNPVD